MANGTQNFDRDSVLSEGKRIYDDIDPSLDIMTTPCASEDELCPHNKLMYNQSRGIRWLINYRLLKENGNKAGYIKFRGNYYPVTAVLAVVKMLFYVLAILTIITLHMLYKAGQLDKVLIELINR